MDLPKYVPGDILEVYGAEEATDCEGRGPNKVTRYFFDKRHAQIYGSNKGPSGTSAKVSKFSAVVDKDGHFWVGELSPVFADVNDDDRSRVMKKLEASGLTDDELALLGFHRPPF